MKNACKSLIAKPQGKGPLGRPRRRWDNIRMDRGVKLTTHFHLMPRSKNAWSYTSTSQYAFMAWCLVKHRDKFAFTLGNKGRRLWTDSSGSE